MRRLAKCGGGLLCVLLLTAPMPTSVPASVPMEERPPPVSSAPADEPRVKNLGPASEVTATTTAERVGDRIYAATNGVSPVVVGAYDPETKRVVESYRLPTGKGAWAMTHVGKELYVGVYGPGDLYRIDTETGTVNKVAEMGGWIWSLDAAPDGTIFAGTYSHGEVYSYDPETGRTQNLGEAVPGQHYVRSIAASRTTVYAGVGTDAHLIAIDRRTGERRDLLPGTYADRTFVAALDLSADGETLAASLTPAGTLLLFDLASSDPGPPVEVQTDGDTYSTAVAFDDNTGDVYFGTRPSGRLYRYDPATRTHESLGSPYPGATFYRIFPGEGRVLAEVESGVVAYDQTTERFERTELSEVGLRAAPELPMAIAATRSRVLVSGKYGMQVHDLRSGESRRVRLSGEAKTITTAHGSIYLALYTQARLVELTSPLVGDTVRTAVADELAVIEHQQTRPTDAAYDPGLDALLVGTEPDYGRVDGALTIHELGTEDVQVYRGVIPNQTVRSVTSAGGVAYLGGSTRNGLGTLPTTKAAELVAFDLRTREVLWQATPDPRAKAITDVEVRGGRLYGVTDHGGLFELDTRTRKVLATSQPGAERGSLVVAGDRLYGTDGDRLYRVTPRRTGKPKISTVEDGLGAEWYGASPLIAAAPDGDSVYTLRGRDLVRIRLSG